MTSAARANMPSAAMGGARMATVMLLQAKSALKLNKPAAVGHQANAARLVEQAIAELKEEQQAASGQ
jgi:hypothetical protein